MTTKELMKAFEAVLFASGEPMSIDRFNQVFEITPEKTVEIMDKLSKKYEESDSGLKLVRMENTYQIATKNEYVSYIKKAFDIRRRTPLSSAALEVLAVVAYNQPVTKSFIEQVRGVDCSGVVTTLIEKGLVEERGRLELPGKPLLYGTTKNFLRCFSLGDLSELPPLPKDKNGEDVTDLGEQLTLDE
ncbi:MAG: SMC-Scp complex subunit ScpB [Ruminococcaceae bacterium]|nr:SMC-Scp complex subunit ScpB [Oscillospiraceae bacterium]